MKTLRIVFPQLEDDDREWLENLFAESKVKKVEWREREIFIKFAERIVPYSPQKITSLLDAITGYFEKKYPGAGQGCHTCGNVSPCDVYAGTCALYLCENCFSGQSQALNAAKQEYEGAAAHYVPGFFGALLFALPGAVLAVLLFVFLETIAAVSTLACMLLARKGYRQFKGKVSPIGAVLISAAGVIMTVAGIFAGYTAVLVKTLLEEGLSPDMVLPFLGEIFQFAEIRAELLKNILVALLVSAVYIIFNLWNMMKEWKFPGITKAKEII